MMIKTVIEIEGKDNWEFEQQAKCAFETFGFQPMDKPEYTRWKMDLYNALKEKNINPHELVEEYRKAQEGGVG